MAYALQLESQLVDAIGRRERAIEINHQLVAVLATTADPWARAAIPWTKAALAVQERGDFDTFEAGLRHAGEIYRDVGDQFKTAVCLDLPPSSPRTAATSTPPTAASTRPWTWCRAGACGPSKLRLLARLARAAVLQGTDEGRGAGAASASGEPRRSCSAPVRAMSLNALANLRRRQGRLPEAETAAPRRSGMYRNAPALRFASSFSRAATTFDVPVGAATSLSVLGFVAEADHEATTAIEHHRAAYHEVVATAHPRAIPLALEGFAAAIVLDGDARWAAQLLGCSATIRAAFGTERRPHRAGRRGPVEQAATAGSETPSSRLPSPRVRRSRRTG